MRCALLINVLRYVAVAAGRIILPPHDEHWPSELIEIGPRKGSAHYMIDVCATLT